MNLRRVRVLVGREATEFLRDPVSLALMIALPVVTLIIFTFVIPKDVRSMPLDVVDASSSPRARQLVRSLRSTGYFDVRERERPLLREGGATLEVPPATDARLARGEPVEAQLVVDGTELALAANGEAIIAATAARASGERIDFEERALFNPRLDSEPFMVPALIGYLFTFLAIMIACVAIVRERAIGTFEQLLVTPAAPAEIAIAKVIVLGAALLVDEAIVVVAGGAATGVWPRGSIALLALCSVIYLAMSLTLGLVISVGAESTTDAVQKAMVTVSLQHVSGLLYPMASMPRGVEVFAGILPISHYLRICRTIYMTDARFEDVSFDLAVIVAWLLVLTPVLVKKLSRERLR